MDDLDVRVIAPGDLWSDAAEFVTVDDFDDGPVRTATYRIDARGGTWDPSDNGEYRVFLKYNQIGDTNGNFAATGVIGTFDAAIPFDDATSPVVQLDGLFDDVNNPTPKTTQDVSVSGSASDAESGIIAGSYEFSVDYFDGTVWTGWVDHPDNDGFKTLLGLNDGLYAVYLSAVNGAGLAGQSATKYFVVDTVSPSKPSIVGLVVDTGESTSDQITKHRTPTFSWTESSDDGTGVAGYWWSVDDPSPESGGTFTGSTAATPLVPIDGPHTFYLRAEDGAGNLGEVATLAFRLDSVSPVVTGLTPTNGGTLAAGPGVILVDFSEAMDHSTLGTSALSLSGTGAGTANVATASWVDADTAKFTIGGDWTSGGVFVELKTGELRDVAGNTLDDFTNGTYTIDAGLSPEIVVETSSGQVVADGNFSVDFSSVSRATTR